MSAVFSRLWYRLRHGRLLRRRRRYFDESWSTGWRSVAWNGNPPRKQVCLAVETGFIPPKSRILEVGCGPGDTAAWLARQGMTVLAVDLSPEAVRRCRERHAGIDGLEFRVTDACEPASPPGDFDVVLDAGCFHMIPVRLRRAYANNLARWIGPGGKLLVLAICDSTFDRLRDQVHGLLAADFAPVHSAATVMRRYGAETGGADNGSADNGGAGPPAGEFHFIRRGRA
jgi:SAM-dependent methyltransferase